jgi:hypothetical protein
MLILAKNNSFYWLDCNGSTLSKWKIWKFYENAFPNMACKNPYSTYFE